MDFKEGYGWNLPVAFYFQVSFEGSPGIGKVAFKEVSGLRTELEVETVTEGGNNGIELKLPKPARHGTVVLKRAVIPFMHTFGKWVWATLEGGLEKPVVPYILNISLMNKKNEPLYTWECTGCYPVKWECESLVSDKNEVAIESVELACTAIKRTD